MKNLRSNFKGVKVNDAEAKLIAAIQKKIGAKTESDAIRESIKVHGKQLNLKVQAQENKDPTKGEVRFLISGAKVPRANV